MASTLKSCIKYWLLPTFLSCSLSAGAAVTMHEFVVKGALLGPRKLFISENIIRIDCPKDGLTIITRKPFTQVTCFNRTSRRICQGETAKAVMELRTLGLLMAEAGEVSISWSPVGKETIQGVPCLAYKAKVTHTEAKPKKEDEADWRKYWVRNDLAVPKTAGDILAAAVAAPNIPGIPQRLEHFGSETDFNLPFLSRSDIETRKKTLKVLITTESKNTVCVPGNFFDVPKGYKQTSDFKKVLLTGSGIQSLKDARSAPGFLFESK